MAGKVVRRRAKTRAKGVRRRGSKRVDSEVTRLEYEGLRLQLAALDLQLKRVRSDLAIQFRRTAELQGEIDLLKHLPLSSISALAQSMPVSHSKTEIPDIHQDMLENPTVES